MKLDNIRWKDPHRRRNLNAVYGSSSYCKYYDIDLLDFTNLVRKLSLRGFIDQ